MALKFALVREIDVGGGFTPDPNPNGLEPPQSSVFLCPERAHGQSADAATRGVSIYLAAVDNTGADIPGAVFAFTAWGHDQGASAARPGPPGAVQRWVMLKAEANVFQRGAYTTTFLCDMYVQLNNATSLGAATKIQVWAVARSL